MKPTISVIIPAHNEEAYISNCLHALFASSLPAAGAPIEVLVIANGCADATVAKAQSVTVPDGWVSTVIDLKEGSKIGALNEGDRRASGAIRVYLDADVTLARDLISQLYEALRADQPRYASGTVVLERAESVISRLYGRFWTTLPFLQEGVPGFGIFAMNASGRARWGDWPVVIADDMFARLNFAPNERIGVAATYRWPLVEGFRNLVRVRRRQNAGVKEIAERYPALLRQEDVVRPGALGVLRRALRKPLGFVAYAAVALAVKSPLFRDKARDNWTRGR
ncbi:glycosyltransferase [Phaeobacter sp.]|uniref:glycosyltransferase family 2 protein n=1 Tax=Phaeobacter sp. TaxID=1902409 RepID=UPI0025DC754D|nr:glycosyltransferase [Phaeobacter sp.]